ncbi:MFS transporter [Promicromonospora sp. NPDC050880]|uniref:MFS transporter n=1 Tax=Promicromonospora sp. NPDC050880 TaxID=3364406 RepID=UPI0037B74860
MTPPGHRPAPWQPGDVREAAGGLFALGLATFVAITTELVPVGLLPLISADLLVSEGVAGLLVTAYAFMVAALAVPLTSATRRLPRKAVLLGALTVYTVSNVLVALAPTFAVVAVARALGGASHAVFFSVSIGYASRLVRPHLAGRALALVTLGASAGFVLGVPLSTSLGTAVGWRAAFLVLAGACALAGLLTALLLPSVPGGGAPPDDAARGARRTALAGVTTANALAYLGHYTVYTYVSVLLLAAGLTAPAIGPALLLIGGLGLIGAAYAAARLDTHPRQTTVVTLLVVGAGVLALGLAFPGTVGTLAAAAVWSIGFGAVAAVFQTAAIRTRGASPDVVGALVNATANIGIGGGAALGALVLDGAGLAAVPYTGAALVGVALLVVLLGRRAFPAGSDSPEA